MVEMTPQFRSVIEKLQEQVLGEVLPEHIPEVLEKAQQPYRLAALPPIYMAAREVRSKYAEDYPAFPVGGVLSATQPENIPYVEVATQLDYQQDLLNWLAGVGLRGLTPLGIAGWLPDILAGDVPGAGAIREMPLQGSIGGEVATMETAAPLLPVIIPGGGGTVEAGGLLGGFGGGDWTDKLLIAVGLIAAAVVASSFFGRKK